MNTSSAATILFVDDDVSLLAALRRTLHRFRNEWKMLFCHSAAEALEQLETNEVDVIVSDVRMPEMDGAELMDIVATRFPSVIRIMLSGQADKQSVVRITGRVHQYFSKPCNSKVLHKAITRILRHRQQIESKELLMVLNGLPSLPSDQTSFDQLVTELKSEPVDMDRVVEIVRGDVGLTCKVLQLVSSAFFGQPQSGIGVELACKTLGSEILSQVLLDSPSLHLKVNGCRANMVDDGLEQQLVSRIHWYLEGEDRRQDQPLSGGQLGPLGHGALSSYLYALWGIEAPASAPSGM